MERTDGIANGDLGSCRSWLRRCRDMIGSVWAGIEVQLDDDDSGETGMMAGLE